MQPSLEPLNSRERERDDRKIYRENRNTENKDRDITNTKMKRVREGGAREEKQSDEERQRERGTAPPKDRNPRQQDSQEAQGLGLPTSLDISLP